MTAPKLAKAHSAIWAEKYIRLGWTLRRDFFEGDDDEPCEYVFEWQGPGEPISPTSPEGIRKLGE
jgi:hypothetical protein